MPSFKLPRLTICALIGAILLAVIWFIAPQQAPVVIYKLNLILVAGYAAYWLDRAVFPYARPDAYLVDCGGKRMPSTNLHWAFVAACLRRAAIMCAAMISVALGL